MFDASKNLALECQASYFSVNFLDMDGLINQYTIWYFVGKNTQFSAANLALAGFLLTNALGESMPSRHYNMFNLRLC